MKVASMRFEKSELRIMNDKIMNEYTFLVPFREANVDFCDGELYVGISFAEYQRRIQR